MPREPSTKPKTPRRRPAKAVPAAVAETPADGAPETAAEAGAESASPKKRSSKSEAKSASKLSGPSLVIVESPAKARTIGKFLGGDFEVRASMGHVRDLKQRGLSLEIDAKGVRPQYEILEEKQKVVAELAKLAKRAPRVYLATDLDREGEAIAWHLVHALDVPPERRSRVTFHEITKRAIDEAFRHPGEIDLRRVDAQQARRVLDRLVGYPVSTILRKAIARGASAGRVQSVAVKLIVDREKEIRAFRAVDYWRVFADLSKEGAAEDFTADLVHLDQSDDDSAWASDAVAPEGTEEDLDTQEVPPPAEGEAAAEADAAKDETAGPKDGAAPKRSRELRLHSAAEAEGLVSELRGAAWSVESVEGKRRMDWAPPPFITSTLQQQASIRLRWPTKKVMSVAQQLYEGLPLGDEGSTGLITYMRTDSVSLAPEAVEACRAYVGERFGKDFVPPKPIHYRSKQGAQEAHEAIRPTDVRRTPAAVRRYLSEEQFALYRLVWERFVSCQIAPAQIDTTTVRVRAGRAVFEARGRVVVFEGWRAVAPAPKKDGDEPALPALAQDDPLRLRDLRSEQRSTQPPPRYTEATLVRRLEKEGIGRPSTYAEIISKIQARKYVAKQQGKFHATEFGEHVTDRMAPYFPDLLDVAFTRRMEEDLDAIETGRMKWQDLVRDFHRDFQKELKVADVEMTAEKFEPAEGVPPCEECGKPMLVRFSEGRKFFGCSGYPECKATRRSDGEGRAAAVPTEHVCEKCGKGMVIRTGRRGPFLACSGYPECRNAKDVREDGTIVEPETTGETCEKCGQPMVVKRGRRGPFLACSGYPTCRNARDVGAPRPAPGPDGAAPAASPSAGAVVADPSVPLPPCPKCGSPTSIRRSFRGAFCGCTRYPECKGTAPVPPGALPKREPPKPAGFDCADCGKPMVIRKGRRGEFAGCSGYPKCRSTRPMDEAPAP